MLTSTYIFFKCLKIKFEKIDKIIFIILISLIFISPTFRSLTIWPDSRILGLTFFTIGIYYFLKFEKERKLVFALNNIFFCSIKLIYKPEFLSFFFFIIFFKFAIYFKFSKNIFLIIIFNLFLACPAIFYVFVLDINFFLKSAAIGIEQNEKVIFNNLFNDVLINFSFMFFYIFPFIATKVINLENYSNIKNIFYASIIF